MAARSKASSSLFWSRSLLGHALIIAFGFCDAAEAQSTCPNLPDDFPASAVCAEFAAGGLIKIPRTSPPLSVYGVAPDASNEWQDTTAGVVYDRERFVTEKTANDTKRVVVLARRRPYVPLLDSILRTYAADVSPMLGGLSPPAELRDTDLPQEPPTPPRAPGSGFFPSDQRVCAAKPPRLKQTCTLIANAHPELLGREVHAVRVALASDIAEAQGVSLDLTDALSTGDGARDALARIVSIGVSRLRSGRRDYVAEAVAALLACRIRHARGDGTFEECPIEAFFADPRAVLLAQKLKALSVGPTDPILALDAQCLAENADRNRQQTCKQLARAVVGADSLSLVLALNDVDDVPWDEALLARRTLIGGPEHKAPWSFHVGGSLRALYAKDLPPPISAPFGIQIRRRLKSDCFVALELAPLDAAGYLHWERKAEQPTSGESDDDSKKLDEPRLDDIFSPNAALLLGSGPFTAGAVVGTFRLITDAEFYFGAAAGISYALWKL